MNTPSDQGGLISVDGVQRSRHEVIKEIELVLEAKKNTNSILTTMYSIFFAIEGGLVFAFFFVNGLGAQVGVFAFGELTIICLLLVTVRSRAINKNCDERAIKLETLLGMRIISNYEPPRDAPLGGLIKVHSTLLMFDIVLIALWPVLLAFRFLSLP